MPDRSELEALLGRVMVATVPSFELSNAILDVLGRAYNSGTHVTANVDAALALVDRVRKEGEGQPHDWSFGILQSAMVAAWDSWIATKMAVELDSSGGWLAELPRAIVAVLLRTLLASHPAEPLKHMPA